MNAEQQPERLTVGEAVERLIRHFWPKPRENTDLEETVDNLIYLADDNDDISSEMAWADLSAEQWTRIETVVRTAGAPAAYMH